MGVASKHAWLAGAVALRPKALPLLIEACLLLGLMLTGTWLIYR
ncbi:MAG: hypothetical protein WB579_19855 [Bryobacteraceae bacterium]